MNRAIALEKLKEINRYNLSHIPESEILAFQQNQMWYNKIERKINEADDDANFESLLNEPIYKIEPPCTNCGS